MENIFNDFRIGPGGKQIPMFPETRRRKRKNMNYYRREIKLYKGKDVYRKIDKFLSGKRCDHFEIKDIAELLQNVSKGKFNPRGWPNPLWN